MNLPVLSRTRTSVVISSVVVVKTGGRCWFGGGGVCVCAVTTVARIRGVSTRPIHGRGLLNLIGGSFLVHYGRGPSRLSPWRRHRVFASAAAAPAPAAPGQLITDRRQIRVNRARGRLHGGLVCPVVWIQRLQALSQPVPLLGCSGPPRDTLAELRIAPAQRGRLPGPKGSREHRVVRGHGAGRGRLARWTGPATGAILHVDVWRRS